MIDVAPSPGPLHFEYLLDALTHEHTTLWKHYQSVLRENDCLKSFLAESGRDIGSMVELWQLDVPVEKSTPVQTVKPSPVTMVAAGMLSSAIPKQSMGPQ